MIIGTGVDVIEIDRIQKAIERWGEHFLKHVFTKQEIAYARGYKNAAEHFAARFAGKEAIFKAMSRDYPHLSWQDIEILNDEQGRPYCCLKEKKITEKIFISLSHSKNYALATAIVTS